MQASLAYEHPHVLHVLEDLFGLRAGGLLRLAVLHQLHPEHEAFAAAVADNVVLLLQAGESSEEIIPDDPAVLLHSLLVDDLEHCPSRCGAHRVATVGVEVDPLLKRGRDLPRGRHSGQRQPIPDSLRHGHDVRRHAVGLEAPVVRPGPAKACLDLIRDADAPVVPDVLVRSLEVAVGEDNGTAHSLNRLREEGSNPPARRRLKHILHVLGVGLAVVAKPAAVRVRVERVVDAKALGHRVLPGGVCCEPHGAEGHSVVAVPQRDHVVVTGVEPRHQDRQVVGLRPGVHKVDGVKVWRELIGELLGKVRHLVVQVDGGGVLNELVLLVHGLHELWVGVTHTDGDDAPKGVEVPPPSLVVQVLLLSLHNHHGPLVIVEDSWT
mmetsp:Transcript_841/g.2617  ORF Transcript_841/g.2617 Transcript_841/m.2617 type:complete len:380 (+) Transcript_841:217-1356(+)